MSVWPVAVKVRPLAGAVVAVREIQRAGIGAGTVGAQDDAADCAYQGADVDVALGRGVDLARGRQGRQIQIPAIGAQRDRADVLGAESEIAVGLRDVHIAAAVDVVPGGPVRTVADAMSDLEQTAAAERAVLLIPVLDRDGPVESGRSGLENQEIGGKRAARVQAQSAVQNQTLDRQTG